jgi:hypothetical protein
MGLKAGMTIAGRAELTASAPPEATSPIFDSAWTVRDRELGLGLGLFLGPDLISADRVGDLVSSVEGLSSLVEDALMLPVVALPAEDGVFVVYPTPNAHTPCASHPAFADQATGVERSVDVARALATLHKTGAVHGALSLHAVAYSAVRAHVWQFGLTGSLEAAEFAKRCRGATDECPYPPEFLAFGGKPSKRTDVFAWGTVAAQMVTGRADMAVAKEVNDGLGLGVDHPLIRVLKSCLNDNASARPRDGEELLGRLRDEGLVSEMAPPPVFGSGVSGGGLAPPPPAFDESLAALPALESWDAENSVIADTPIPGDVAAVPSAGVDRSQRATPPPPPPPGAGRGGPPPPPGGARATKRVSTPPPIPTPIPAAASAPPPPPPAKRSSAPVRVDRAASQPPPPKKPAPASSERKPAELGPGAAAFTRALDRAISKEAGDEPDAIDLTAPEGGVDVLRLARGESGRGSADLEDPGDSTASRSGGSISGVRRGLVQTRSHAALRTMRLDIPRTPGPHGIDGSWLAVPLVLASVGMLGSIAYGFVQSRGGVGGAIGIVDAADTDGGTPDYDAPVLLPDLPPDADISGEPIVLVCPGGTVELSESVCIDRTEAPRRGRLPTTKISYGEAAAACKERGARLCTSQEWVAGCRGPDGAKYPYGDAFKPSCNLASAAGFAGTLAPAGQYLSCLSAVGALDMLGNAGEWVEGGHAMGGDYSAPRTVTCESKGRPPKGFKGDNVGYRCCLDRNVPEADAADGADATGGVPAAG